MDGLIRRRIRQLLWKQWKKKAVRGMRKSKEGCKNAPPIEEYAYNSNRYRRLSKTPIIHKALSKGNLLKEGWFSIELVEGQI